MSLAGRLLASLGAVALGVTVTVAASYGSTQDGAKPQEGAPAAKPVAAPAAKTDKAEVIVPFFGNEKCPITGKATKQDKAVDVSGTNVFVCCNGCIDKVKADGKAMVAAAYKEPKAAVNKTCPTCGKAIEAGKAVDVAFEGQKVALCCAGCEAAFKKAPRIMTVKAVYGAEDLANKTCPMMEEKIQGEPILVVYKGKIVHLCCEDCIADFKKAPDEGLKLVTAGK